MFVSLSGSCHDVFVLLLLAVAPLQAASITSSSFLLRWSAPASGTIISYSLFQVRGVGQSALRIHFTTVSTDGEFLVTGLQPLIVYRYFLRACTASRCVESSITVVTTLSGGRLIIRFLFRSSAMPSLCILSSPTTSKYM